MKMYVLSAAPTRWSHWGDYADILVHGMSAHLSRLNGFLQLERVGPFVPPITFPGISDIVLTAETKTLIASKLHAASFRPVSMTKCVRLDWTGWDVSSDEPAGYPDGGEPENYILSRPHDAELAAELRPFWELVPDVVEAIQGQQGAFRCEVYEGQHLVRAALSGGYNFISEQLRDVLLAVAPGLVSIREARLEEV